MPVALITGASAGIGAAFAHRLAEEGFDLILVARRRKRLEELAAQFPARRVELVTADLATDEGIAEVVQHIVRAPRIDLLVNNAGFGLAGRFYEVPPEDHDRMHRLHVLATMHLTHAALRRMVPAGSGGIINVASVAGFTPSSGTVSYSATKHWINVFTEGVWLDLKMRGSPVNVQSLCPGFTYSEFHDVMPMDRGNIPGWLWCDADDVVDTSLRALPTGKLFVVPGIAYKLLVAATGIFPRSLIRAGALWFARNIRDKQVS
jgi:short-subunit dehydrogenase